MNDIHGIYTFEINFAIFCSYHQYPFTSNASTIFAYFMIPYAARSPISHKIQKTTMITPAARTLANDDFFIFPNLSNPGCLAVNLSADLGFTIYHIPPKEAMGSRNRTSLLKTESSINNIPASQIQMQPDIISFLF